MANKDDNLPALGLRKKQILFSAIDNYIKVASPITSLLVKDTEMHDLSTATLRNELSALEAMGFLKQLHTSSGRVPTTKGYRFFVNEIIQNTTVSSHELKNVKDNLFTRTNNLSEIVKSIADALTSATNYPAVVVLDGFENLKVLSINIMPLIGGQILIIIDTNAGVISNTLNSTLNVDKEVYENASKIFSDVFSNKTVGYLMHNAHEFSDKITNALKAYEEIFKLVLFVLDNYANPDNPNVTSGGIVKLLDSPEYSSIEKAKDILNILDDKKQLKDIFDTSHTDGISVKIGEENQNQALVNCAVIKTPIVIDGNKIATIGVIGPERIDYASIASALKLIADQINDNRSFNNNKKEE